METRGGRVHHAYGRCAPYIRNSRTIHAVPMHHHPRFCCSLGAAYAKRGKCFCVPRCDDCVPAPAQHRKSDAAAQPGRAARNQPGLIHMYSPPSIVSYQIGSIKCLQFASFGSLILRGRSPLANGLHHPYCRIGQQGKKPQDRQIIRKEQQYRTRKIEKCEFDL